MCAYHQVMDTVDRDVMDCLAAADAGQPNALYDLGLYYSTGHGVELNYIEAHKWFSLAAQRGVTRALEDRAELSQEMTREEIAEALRQARQWLAVH